MKKFKIIAVDDNKSYLDFLVEFFSKHKERYDLPKANCLYQFKDEYNVEFMLERINDVQPDVVLMDFSFDLTGKPADYGIELVQRIRSKFPNQPIIMLVGDEDADDDERWKRVNRSFDAGASAYIGKKEVTKCIEAINEVVKGDVYVSETNKETFLKWRKIRRTSPVDLTPRQREVLQLMSQDLTIGEAADKMIGEENEPITNHTVSFHLKNIKQRLNTKTLQGTIAKAIIEGII